MAKKVLALVGGIAKGSLNKKLYGAVKEVSSDSLEFSTFDISTLPFYSQDLEGAPPESVLKLKDLVQNAEAILFITPEYNRSIPGVLKNAIDWCSRPPGKSVWSKKMAGVMGASGGNIGTFGAQNHLRQILSALGVVVMPQPDFYFNGSKAFDENGIMTDEKSKEFLKKFLTSFEQWI